MSFPDGWWAEAATRSPRYQLLNSVLLHLFSGQEASSLLKNLGSAWSSLRPWVIDTPIAVLRYIKRDGSSSCLNDILLRKKSQGVG